jgi:hypothetical protein
MINKNKTYIKAFLSKIKAWPWLKFNKKIKFVYKYINLGPFKYLPQLLYTKGSAGLSMTSSIYQGALNKGIKQLDKLRARIIKHINIR